MNSQESLVAAPAIKKGQSSMSEVSTTGSAATSNAANGSKLPPTSTKTDSALIIASDDENPNGNNLDGEVLRVEDEEEEEVEESSYENASESDDYDEKRRKVNPAGSTRSQGKKKAKVVVQESYYEPRKSSRASKSTTVYHDEEEEDEDEDSDASVKVSNVKTSNREGSTQMEGVESEGKSKGADLVVISDEEEEPEPTLQGSMRPQDQHTVLCMKCGQPPLGILHAKFLRKKEIKDARPDKKKRNRDEDTDGEEEMLLSLGAWMECGVCIGSYHFGCLHESLKKEIVQDLKQVHIDSRKTGPRRKTELVPTKTHFIKKCWSCKKSIGRRCFECGASGRKTAAAREVEASRDEDDMVVDAEEASVPGLMFRCNRCNRACHYDCLLPLAEEIIIDEEGNEIVSDKSTQAMIEGAATEGVTTEAVVATPSKKICRVSSYFKDKRCHECFAHEEPLDLILAWREVKNSEMTATDAAEADDLAEVRIAKIEKKDETTGQVFSIPSARNPLAAAEYLVKWQGTSYRRLEWISHSFLAATSNPKLNHFLIHGSKVSLDAAQQEDEEEEGDDPEDLQEKLEIAGSSPLPDPEAESRVPPFWRTVDRVLAVTYTLKNGKTVDHKEFSRTHTSTIAEGLAAISQCYLKWIGLSYADSTHEEPPKIGEEGYEKFVDAYEQFIAASDKNMRIPNLTKAQMQYADKKRTAPYVPLKVQPSHVSGGTLMDFQLDGVNFMKFKWWTRDGCILADEMGLGKTVQIITLLSSLAFDEGAKPFLVTVPNSTIGNWIREFAKWSPKLRVVPYMGDATSRKIIEDHEMFEGAKTLKTHVVLCTYESLANNITVFKRVTRWDCLVVDEGQRLKGGSKGLLFKAINSLNINHRIILTGTPLNNNLGELFNLLSFINPSRVLPLDLKDSDVTPELVDEVRKELKPYFLRRTKESSLDLPPLTELVVEVTMTPLQRTMYMAILSGNSAAMNGIYQKPTPAAKGKKQTKVKAANFNNILMELRKLLGHPYLISPDIERRDVTPIEAHMNLVKASAKLEFLDKLLPKLHAAGHRVLIFSQFKITLNILEDFLRGINLKYLRLDGDTKGQDRQRGIDAYQAENSPYFIYLLSTRAGGVGINLTKADTVIMFDQDFNPFQDLQAVARAHRFGQVNPVKVFKLLVKYTCEEKIFKDGGRKMGLDHLIIQRIDAVGEAEADVSSLAGLLQYGAKVIFDEKASLANAINYSDADMDALIASAYQPPEPKEKKEKKSDDDDSAGGFSHARIWEKAAGSVQEVVTGEDAPAEDLKDFWANILAENDTAAEIAAAQQEDANGRGKRARKSNPIYTDSAKKVPKAVVVSAKERARLEAEEKATVIENSYVIPEESDDETDDEWETLNVEELRGLIIPNTAPGSPDAAPKGRRKPGKLNTTKNQIEACNRFLAETTHFKNPKLVLLLEAAKEELAKGKTALYLEKSIDYFKIVQDNAIAKRERKQSRKSAIEGNFVGSDSSMKEEKEGSLEDLDTPREPIADVTTVDSDEERVAKKPKLEV